MSDTDSEQLIRKVFNAGNDLLSDISKLTRALRDSESEIKHYKALLDNQHERARKAELLWREHSGQPNIIPDLGDLLDWLIDRGDRWQAVISAARSGKQEDITKALNRYDEFWNGCIAPR